MFIFPAIEVIIAVNVHIQYEYNSIPYRYIKLV